MTPRRFRGTALALLWGPLAGKSQLSCRFAATYVGLQAPTSSCTSCAKLSPSSATLQGTAAANDAVAQAKAIGIGPGSPIYNDMESYTRTSSATSATLAFSPPGPPACTPTARSSGPIGARR